MEKPNCKFLLEDGNTCEKDGVMCVLVYYDEVDLDQCIWGEAKP